MVLGLHLQGYGLDSHSPQTSSPHPSVRWASSPRKTRPSTSSRAFSGTHQDYLLSSFQSLISNVECLFNNSIAHFFVSWALHIYKQLLVLFNIHSMQLWYIMFFVSYQHKYLYYLQHFFFPNISLNFLRYVFINSFTLIFDLNRKKKR